MISGLSEGLKRVVNKISSISFFTDKEVEEVLREVQRVLLRSDVNYEVVIQLSERIKKNFVKKKELTKREALITTLYNELTNFLGVGEPINIIKKPFKIMLIGLFGSGKTSTIGKLAYYYKKSGYKCCVVGLDNYRPAAFEQLKQLSEKIGVKSFGEDKLKNYLDPWKRNEENILKNEIILIDTAGRNAVNEQFLKEIEEIEKTIKPDEVLLVIPADLGQEAEKLTLKFKESVKITGLIITKLDSSGKGGGALTSSYLTKTPVRFITTGEPITELEPFKPERFISRLLGMGDLESLLEKINRLEVNEERVKRFVKGEFTLIDFYDQIEQVNKMGGLKKMLSFLPQVGALKKMPIEVGEEKLKDYKIIMQSMTWEELSNPSIINHSRIRRISEGSGKSEKTVRELIKSYGMIKKLTKGLDERKLKRLSKKFGL